MIQHAAKHPQRADCLLAAAMKTERMGEPPETPYSEHIAATDVQGDYIATVQFWQDEYGQTWGEAIEIADILFARG